MSIANAVQRGNSVYVYSEKGQILSVLSGGTQRSDGLVGYTGSSVSVRRGMCIYTYNEKGRQISVIVAK